jgi:hypothetical protein
MSTHARPTRLLRVADRRVARLASPYPMPPLGDDVCVTIAPLGEGPGAEVDALLPERWAELRDGELRRMVAAALERESAKRRARR